MRIAGIDFPEKLMHAMRDGRLVIFAGAGVSMGAPALLPSFSKLADKVAEGTGESRRESETEDRFLGRLADKGNRLHKRTADLLNEPDPPPTDLHAGLLRIYRTAEDVRIVTTNFDVLFERASGTVFGEAVRYYVAPALPLGGRFQGIVHIHGSVCEPKEMILTDKDFGRAYLTENDGWARRFLVDLFSEFTVLFVGYSHQDTIMNYLGRALPGGSGERYVLTGSKQNESRRWLNLGIEPIEFPQSGEHDFVRLTEGVSSLAEFTNRGVLDWQRIIVEIAESSPPIDDESGDIIATALDDPVKTRFFTEAATSPEWIDWLDRRHHLDALFNEGAITDQDRMLGDWLAGRFSFTDGDSLLATIAKHNTKIHPYLWGRIGWKLCELDNPDENALKRWSSVLTCTIPNEPDELILLEMAGKWTEFEMWNRLLQLFDILGSVRLRLIYSGGPGSPATGSVQTQHFLLSRQSHRPLREIWEECLRPNLEHCAEDLLLTAAEILERDHNLQCDWQTADSSWSLTSFERAAIESHEQDAIRHQTDVSIDVARDCLEWMVCNKKENAFHWLNGHVKSEVPLLRRLAIHAMSLMADIPGDCKIAWLLKNTEVGDVAVLHEAFRLIKTAYPEAGQDQREALIQAILAYRPTGDDEDAG